MEKTSDRFNYDEDYEEYMENTELPAELSPINLLDYFHRAFGACGCAEIDEMIQTVVRILEWAKSKLAEGNKDEYNTLYPEVGIYYLLMGRLHDLNLAEHGTSIRYPWLTDEGKRLLDALKATPPESIVEATGEACSGVWYEVPPL